MTKYTVLFEQWVQEITEVEIEAETPFEAYTIARTREDEEDLDLDWSDGSDVDYRGIVEVKEGAQIAISCAEILELQGSN